MRTMLDDFMEKLGVNPDGVGIYHLKQGDKVVYVGQTKNIKSRIAKHFYSNDKEFDGIEFFDCDEEILNDVEAREIVHFNPIYNKSLPSSSIYMKEDEAICQIESIIREALNSRVAHKTKGTGHIPPRLYFLQDDVRELTGALSECVKEFISAGE